MAELYPLLRLVHISAVILSGSMFALRGVLMLADSTYTNNWRLRYASYAIDTTLLSAAVVLTISTHQYPFVQGWLTVKVLLLMVYIYLGLQALKYGRTRLRQKICFFMAVLVYLFIASVAHAHHPLGILWLLLAR